ncbi:MAG: hypothetical protein R2795_26920 [Saprospiraceae bacterium]
MNVSEIDFPENFRSIIRRLQAAVQEKEVRDTMTIEDDFIAEINDYEHRIAESEKQREEALQQKALEQSLKEEALRRQEEERKQKKKHYANRRTLSNYCSAWAYPLQKWLESWGWNWRMWSGWGRKGGKYGI